MKKIGVSLLTITLAMQLATVWAITVSAATVTGVNWSLGAAIPNPHEGAAAATAGIKLYVISGTNLSCADNGVPTTAVDVYDSKTNSFSSGPSVNFARAEHPLAAAVGLNIFLIGGTTACSGATENVVEELNLTTKVWSVLPSASDLPAPLDGANHCGTVIGSSIYYFQLAGIGVFDTTTLSWTVLPANPLLNPSNFCQATVAHSELFGFGKKILITGPGDGTADASSQRVLIFDPATGSIKQTPAQTAPFVGHVAVDLHSVVVAAGGDFTPTTVQRVKPASVTTFGPLPVASEDAVGGRINGIFYIAGGSDGTSDTPQVLIGTPVVGVSSGH
jgi:hypothetical protein